MWDSEKPPHSVLNSLLRYHILSNRFGISSSTQTDRDQFSSIDESSTYTTGIDSFPQSNESAGDYDIDIEDINPSYITAEGAYPNVSQPCLSNMGKLSPTCVESTT